MYTLYAAVATEALGALHCWVCVCVCRDDRSVMLLNQPFGYGSKGHISITVSKLALYRRHDQADQDFSLKNLGIILSDTQTQPKLEEYLRAGKCPLQVSSGAGCPAGCGDVRAVLLLPAGMPRLATVATARPTGVCAPPINQAFGGSGS